jgi:ankyrin repeat protein
MEDLIIDAIKNNDVTKLLHTINILPLNVNTPIDPNDNHSRSAMYYAMSAVENIGATEALIMHANGDVNAYINFGYGGMTLFHLACRDNPEMALMVLGLGGRADCNKHDRLNGMNALSYAIHGGKMHVIKKLIDEYGMLPTNFDLFDAVFSKNCIEVVKYIEPYLKVPSLGSAFHLACKYGKLDLVKHWAQRFDPKKIDLYGETAIMAHLGSYMNIQYNNINIDILKFLLDIGVDPDIPKKTDTVIMAGDAKKGDYCLDRAVLIKDAALRKQVLDIMFRHCAQKYVSAEVAMAYDAWYAQMNETIEHIAASLPDMLPLDVRIDIAIDAECLSAKAYKYLKK